MYPADDIKPSRHVLPCKLPFTLIMPSDPEIVAAIAKNGGIATSKQSKDPDINGNEENQAEINEPNNSGLDGLKSGRGNATLAGGMITPEATPDPDNARIEADRRRREEEEKSSDSQNEATVNQEDSNAGSTSAGDDDVIQSILKCGKDEHRKVLRIDDNYENKSKEEAAIKRAVWKRGTDTHPKYNKQKDAQQAFESMYTAFHYYYSLLTYNIGVIKAAEALNCSEDWIKELKE